MAGAVCAVPATIVLTQWAELVFPGRDGDVGMMTAVRLVVALGLALYAKRPFVGTLERLGGRGMPLLRADFGDMVVYVAHPMPPASARLEADNREYLAALAERMRAETPPVVVAGDLNSTLWSANIGPLLGLRMQWPEGSGVGYSWPVGRPWLAIQIDQVLGLGIKAGRFEVLSGVGSDHYPVRAELVM